MLMIAISILPFMVCLFWLVTFSAQFRKHDRAKRMLTAFLAVCTLLYFCHAIYFNKGLGSSMESLWALCSLSVYPMYYLYICVLTGGYDKGRDRSGSSVPYWILVPGVLVAFFMLLFPGDASDTARKLLFFVQITAVCWMGIARLRRFDHEILSCYADPEGRSVSDIKAILIAFVVTSVVSAFANAIGKKFFAHNDLLLAIVACMFSVMLYVISFLGFSRGFSYEKMKTEIPEDKHEEHPEEESALGQKIETIMTAEKMYLQKGLTIADLASKAGSCRTYISNYINKAKGMSFSDYVNTLRIEEAKHILLSEQDIKFVSLADRLGFTSEQSFYRNFKKFTGMTPAQWKKQQG